MCEVTVLLCVYCGISLASLQGMATVMVCSRFISSAVLLSLSSAGANVIPAKRRTHSDTHAPTPTPKFVSFFAFSSFLIRRSER
jgi:hypothetical protein